MRFMGRGTRLGRLLGGIGTSDTCLGIGTLPRSFDKEATCLPVSKPTTHLATAVAKLYDH